MGVSSELVESVVFAEGANYQTLMGSDNRKWPTYFELESRRALALVGYARSGKSAADAKKSLKEAQLAYDLEPTHDWFSHLVLCLAFHVSKNEKEALKHLDKAEEKATDENLDLCKRIREAIADGRTFEWDFQDGYGDRKPN